MGTKRTRICRAAVTAIALMICFGIAVEAAGVTTIGENHLDGTFEIMRRASNSFDVTIPAGEIMAAETSFFNVGWRICEIFMQSMSPEKPALITGLSLQMVCFIHLEQRMDTLMHR